VAAPERPGRAHGHRRGQRAGAGHGRRPGHDDRPYACTRAARGAARAPGRARWKGGGQIPDRVLIAEDETIIRLDLRAMLDRAGSDSLREALAARKIIERAKGLLMERDGLTEAEAFARMRSAAQRTGKTLHDIAQAVAATYSPK